MLILWDMFCFFMLFTVWSKRNYNFFRKNYIFFRIRAITVY